MCGPCIIGSIYLAQVPFVYAPDITERVHRVYTLWVVARQAGIDFHPFKFMQIDRQPCDFSIIQIQSQGDTLEWSAPF